MQGIGDIVIDGRRAGIIFWVSQGFFLRSRKWGSRKDFVVGLHSWINDLLYISYISIIIPYGFPKIIFC